MEIVIFVHSRKNVPNFLPFDKPSIGTVDKLEKFFSIRWNY